MEALRTTSIILYTMLRGRQRFIPAVCFLHVFMNLLDNRMYLVYTLCKGYDFNVVSVANSSLDLGVYYNYTISRGRDIVSSLSLVTQAYLTLLPNPQLSFDFRAYCLFPSAEALAGLSLAFPTRELV